MPSLPSNPSIPLPAKPAAGAHRVPRSAKAFTLTEILVACAIMGILSVILFSALSEVTNVISLAQGKTTTYQDVRTVMEQMSRELQQAIPYDNPDHVPTFVATNSYVTGVSDGHLHFIAVIDNTSGQEEVEVHYIYDGENTLYKALVPYGSGSSAWDIDAGPSSGWLPDRWWRDTPDWSPYSTVLKSSTFYTPVLDGVKSFQFLVWTNTVTPCAHGIYPPCFNTTIPIGAANACIHAQSWQTNMLPAYIQVNLEVFDGQVIRRWGTAANAFTKVPNQVRSFHNLVCFPRSTE
jgi:prepilin-type N-terminal cleavage/methylation domain-containing protein